MNASSADPDPRTNMVLASLPEGEYEEMAGRLEPVRTTATHQVFEKGQPLSEVYFPVDAVFSVVSYSDGHTVEVSTIGNEGMVGLPAFLGATVSPNSAFCQVPGRALRMSVTRLREVLGNDGGLHRMLSLYTQATIVQLSQNVACNRLHSDEQRCARWLLMTRDRTTHDEFPLTSVFLSRMLGVPQTEVTEILQRLRHKELIRTRDDSIVIEDRENLEAVACECYRVIRDETTRLLRG